MTAPEAVSDPELQKVEWDLSHLLDGAGDDPQAAVDTLLDESKRRADAFAERYAGKLAELDGSELVEAMHELAEIEEIAGRAGTYAHLSFSIDTADPARGALLQRVEEKGTAIETALLFFHLEWAALDDERAEELLAADGLDFARHHLQTARRYRPHLLSEPEERILTEKTLSGRSAWVRLFEEQTAAITVDLADADEPVSLEIALARLFDPDREVRRDAAERVTAALKPGLRTRAYAFNTLLADKMTDDRLRVVPALAGRAQPLQRGLRRVGAGADRGRPRALRAAAPLVPAEGAAARHRPARGLRPDGRRHAGQREGGVAGGQGDRARRVLDVLGRARHARRALLRRVVDRRPGPARQARRRVLLLRHAERAPVRDAQLHVPAPRRADAGARARPRRARRAGRGPGRVPHGDAADAGRDRVGVRRDARVRAAAGGVADARVAAVAAGRVDRGLDRDRVPPGRDEPLRGPRAHDPARRGRAVRGPLRRAVGAVAGGAARRRGRGHRGLPLVVVLRARISSPRRATSTRTPTGSCSRWRSTAATRRRARRSCRPTSTC